MKSNSTAHKNSLDVITALRGLCQILLLSYVICFGTSTAVAKDDADNKIRLYLDADQTGTRASGIAIERGIRVALDEVDNTILGRKVELIVRDHHGSSVRSKSHLQEYLNDDTALAVFSGLHSPPLLENLAFIHENKILLLDPWAAAGPITRYPSDTNWVFRLSVDDSKAGAVIAKHALKEGFKQPFLLLENTGWGKSNHRTMTRALARHNITPMGVKWFNWNLGIRSAKMILRDIYSSGADVIFLVANAPEGKTFAKAMLALRQEQTASHSEINPFDILPLRSHWGITGGDFPEVIDAKMRRHLDLKFLQTRFSFNSSPPTALSKQVLKRAMALYPGEITNAADITAPTGFIHAYDLCRILIAAINQSGLSGDIQRDRDTVRKTLEVLKAPIQGLIKNYVHPFQVFNESHPDAHEALDAKDLVMGYYNEDNRIVIVQE